MMAELTLKEIKELRLITYRLYDYLTIGGNSLAPYRDKDSIKMVETLADKLLQIENDIDSQIFSWWIYG